MVLDKKKEEAKEIGAGVDSDRDFFPPAAAAANTNPRPTTAFEQGFPTFLSRPTSTKGEVRDDSLGLDITGRQSSHLSVSPFQKTSMP